MENKNSEANQRGEIEKAAQVFGSYILLSSVVLSVALIISAFILSPASGSGYTWYYVFLVVIVAVYVLYQRVPSFREVLTMPFSRRGR